MLLVGDAGGFYDPFTGEGVFTALRSAELAVTTMVRALRSGDVSARALAEQTDALPHVPCDGFPASPTR